MRKSSQVALGGLASALCLVLMFLTGVMPFATYALPAFAGAVLIAVVIENGASTAFVVYGAVSFLSIFIVPDREAALMFIVFFGYYPIIKAKLEKIKSKVVEMAVKIAIFNFAIISSYAAAVNILGMAYLMEGMGDFGKYTMLILLALGNVTFVVYDFALTNVIVAYLRVLRPKFAKRLK